MPKVITIGSALVDIFIRSEQFSVDAEGSLVAQANGGKLAVESFAMKTGGGGGNTAVGFARMGFETSLVSETGRDELAELVINDLKRENVNTAFIIQEKKEETGGSVILTDSDTGDRTILTHRGASSMLDPQDLPAELPANDLVHLSSISGRLQTIQQIFQAGPQKISWNPGMADIQLLLEGQLTLNRQIEYFFVNKQEWETLLPVQSQVLAQCVLVFITNGTQGGEVYHHGQRALEYQATKVEAIDSTGAGDAFAVGLVSAQLQGKDLPTSLEWAKQNATSVVQHVGAKQGLLKMT